MLTSCDANDPEVCVQKVKEAFPNSVVYKSGNRRFDFFVHDTINKRYLLVRTMNAFDANVSSVEVLNIAK
jgi:hypothetical protein